MSSETIDEDVWGTLHEAAVEAMHHSYSPYSHFPVGAAALVDDGRIVTGCNVENAAYGVALCAECGLVSQLVRGGGGRLVAFACVNAKGETISPCGRCRQLLLEHGGRGLVLEMPSGRRTMAEVLPDGFGPDDLATVAGAATPTGTSAGEPGQPTGAHVATETTDAPRAPDHHESEEDR